MKKNLCKVLLTIAVLVVFAYSSAAYADDKQNTVINFIAAKINKDNETWTLQQDYPEKILDIDTQHKKAFHVYLQQVDPNLLNKILLDETQAKYKAVFVFKNASQSLYKVVRYFENDSAVCTDRHTIHFRNYKFNGDAPDLHQGAVSGIIGDSGACPPIH